ncbi:hypothetical protein PIB30_026065, partial [Stylosanthes scabra]|nr:hypothetical protein [Stylosanthes scabra]
PKTAIRCRCLSKTWKEELSSYDKHKTITYNRKDKNSSIFMHFGPPPWVDVEEFLNSIEVYYCQAIFGYAFEYTPNTDQYYVVHVGDILVHKLGYHNVVHAGKAWWID